MVRQMNHRCQATPESETDELVYDYCNNGIAKESLAFPNYFVTIAPAEWNFPLPSWLDELVAAGHLSEVSGMVALHIQHVLHVWVN